MKTRSNVCNEEKKNESKVKLEIGKRDGEWREARQEEVGVGKNNFVHVWLYNVHCKQTREKNIKIASFLFGKYSFFIANK